MYRFFGTKKSFGGYRHFKWAGVSFQWHFFLNFVAMTRKKSWQSWSEFRFCDAKKRSFLYLHSDRDRRTIKTDDFLLPNFVFMKKKLYFYLDFFDWVSRHFKREFKSNAERLFMHVYFSLTHPTFCVAFRTNTKESKLIVPKWITKAQENALATALFCQHVRWFAYFRAVLYVNYK